MVPESSLPSLQGPACNKDFDTKFNGNPFCSFEDESHLIPKLYTTMYTYIVVRIYYSSGCITFHRNIQQINIFGMSNKQ